LTTFYSNGSYIEKLDSSNVTKAISSGSVEFSELTFAKRGGSGGGIREQGAVASGFLSGRCRGRAGHGRRHGARDGPVVVGDRDDNAGCGPCRSATARDGDNNAGRGAASGPGVVRVGGGRLGAGWRQGR
jgi:hypothetical protein